MQISSISKRSGLHSVFNVMASKVRNNGTEHHRFVVRSVAARGYALCLVIAMCALFFPHLLSAQVTPVVVSSQVNLTPSGGLIAGPAVADACGDIYINQSTAGVIEIQAVTGQQTVISANTNGYNNGTGLAIDSTRSNLYFPTSSQWYSSSFTKVPITNCVPGSGVTFANNLGNISDYYYGTASKIAVDIGGDVFFTPTCCSTGQIIEESAGGVPSIIQNSWPNSIAALAADSGGNIYFTDGSANVYELKAPYSSAATVFSGSFTDPVGLSFDGSGDLFVADNGSPSIYEIPAGTSGLIPTDKFLVIANISLTSNPAVDASGNLYVSNYSGDLLEEKIGSAVLASTALGQSSASVALNYAFNASVTPASISVLTGTAASVLFSAGSGGCSAGQTYSVGDACSVAITFKPSAVGLQTGAAVFTDASGAEITTTALSGIGLGPAVDIDPGVITSLAGAFTTPEAVAVDNLGNLYMPMLARISSPNIRLEAPPVPPSR